MSKSFIAYGVILSTLLIIDGLWLGLIAKTFYRERIGHLMSPAVSWWAVVLFYFIYALGILILVVRPGTSTAGVFALGAVLGLVAYGTYDLTNQAVMRAWPLTVTVIDMLWGSLLTALAALAGHLAAR
jgi:uncharacterized membrane protein